MAESFFLNNPVALIFLQSFVLFLIIPIGKIYDLQGLDDRQGPFQLWYSVYRILGSIQKI